MPITQTRMLALISAASDYQQALESAQRSIALALDRATDQPEQALGLLQELTLTISPLILLNAPVASATVIATERQHFRREAKRNEGNARRLARARARKRPAGNNQRVATGATQQLVGANPATTPLGLLTQADRATIERELAELMASGGVVDEETDGELQIRLENEEDQQDE